MFAQCLLAHNPSVGLLLSCAFLGFFFFFFSFLSLKGITLHETPSVTQDKQNLKKKRNEKEKEKLKSYAIRCEPEKHKMKLFFVLLLQLPYLEVEAYSASKSYPCM